MKGSIDFSSLHEPAGSHSYLVECDPEKKINVIPGALFNDGMRMMSYTTRYMYLHVSS